MAYHGYVKTGNINGSSPRDSLPRVPPRPISPERLRTQVENLEAKQEKMFRTMEEQSQSLQRKMDTLLAETRLFREYAVLPLNRGSTQVDNLEAKQEKMFRTMEEQSQSLQSKMDTLLAETRLSREYAVLLNRGSSVGLGNGSNSSSVEVYLKGIHESVKTIQQQLGTAFRQPLPAVPGFSFGGVASAISTATPQTPIGYAAPIPQSQNAFVAPTLQSQAGFSTPPPQTQTSFASLSKQPSTGLSLGAAVPQAPNLEPTASSAIKLSFGATPTSAAPAFGATPTSAAPAFSLGTPATTTATSAAPPAFGFGLSTAKVTAPAATITPSAVSSGTTGFSFGNAGSTSLAASTTTPLATISLGATTASTANVLAPSTSTAMPSSSGIAFSAPKSLASTTPASGAVQTTVGISAPVSLSTATTTTSSSAAPAPSTTMTYRQLEESINKWTIELEEQEKIFLNQATQVNSWDRMIFENGETIVNLNEDVEKVKADQTRLEHELDFIKGLQDELEDVLKPLEASVTTPNSTTSGNLNAGGLNVTAGVDTEREQVYQKAEQMDAQLQRMSEDLKDIIVHINAQNRAQDDSNDPIVQIGRILNAQMDSLQLVDQSMGQVQKKLDDVTKLQELRKKENERIGLF